MLSYFMVNILFCGNDKVFDGFLTCALSICKRTETKEPFRFIIYTLDLQDINPKYKAISQRHIDFLDSAVKKYNPDSSVELVDVTKIYEEEFRGCPNEMCYTSPYTLLRLFADLVPQMPEKFLYLDADVMSNRDITMLYDIDVSGVEYAGAHDHYFKLICPFLNPRYVNAGVLLFNLSRCRETGLFKKARQLIKTKKLMFADQSALNRSTTRKKLLSQRFNDQKFLYRNTVIRHFSQRLFYTPTPHIANVKQWDVDGVHNIYRYHQFDDILEEYIDLMKEFNKTDN